MKRPASRRKDSRKKRHSGNRFFFAGAFMAVLFWMLWWGSLRATRAVGRGARKTLARPVAALPRPSGPRPLLLAACLLGVLQFHGLSGMSPDLRSAFLLHLQSSSGIGVALGTARLNMTLSTVRSLALQATRIPDPALPLAPPITQPQPVVASRGAPAQAPVAASVPTGAVAGVVSGIATWYGGVDGFDAADGMADGTAFNPDDPTIAASNHWPLGTRLLVCHGGNCLTVCIRDRGSFGHALDLSRAAFSYLAPLSSGVISVTVQVLP